MAGKEGEDVGERRTIGLYFKVTKEELEMIGRKMEQAGTKNKRAYLRKMAVDGYIVHLDMGSVKEMNRLLRSVSGNINQIARRCNETGNLYAEDVADLRRGCAEVQKGMFGLAGKFAGLQGGGRACACLGSGDRTG